MNERIRELSDIAYKNHLAKNPHSSYGRRSDYDREFAELIVKECGQWFNNRLVVEPDHGLPHRIERNRAVVGVMKEFNEHFGVE